VDGYDGLDVANSTSAVVSGLTPGVTYYYRVWAYNMIGISAPSSTIAVTTPCNHFISTSANPPGSGTTSGGGVKNCNTTVTVKATPAAGYRFSSWTEFGFVVSTSATLQFVADNDHDLVANFVDGQKPVLAITGGPAPGARIVNSSVVIQGTASDNDGLDGVSYSVNGGGFVPASGTTSWSFVINCKPGTNTFTVQALDNSGNQTSLTRSFTYVVTSPLTLIVNPLGAGKITSPFNSGANLEVGHSYTIAAVAQGNYLFSNWGGSVSSSSAQLTFVMVSNMVLQANFIPNPFAAVSGTYNGLFSSPASGVNVETAGLIRDFKVGLKGGFSGKLFLNGTNNGFSGTFDASGHAQTIVSRPASKGGRVG
jgi:hypothetical protein